MKAIKLFLAIVTMTITFSANAQSRSSVKKETIKVYGNCEMCQSKIEKAAKTAGATTAKWDVDSKMLAVSYNTSKSSADKIEKAVAAAGYDTEHEVSTEDAFNTLPGCCQYERKAGTKSGEEKKD
jgi:copper chaperone CopZ